MRTVCGIGSITAGGMGDSRVLAGVETCGPDLPDTTSKFNLLASIQRITVTGLHGSSQLEFQNSDVAAWSVKTVRIASVEQNIVGD